MTTYTEAAFAARVLKDLGLVGSNEEPTADMLEWSRETSTSEILLLSSIGLPIWNGSQLSIPQEYLTALSRRVGLAVAPSFGMTDIATAQLAMREAERYLTVLAAPKAMPNPLRTEFPSRSRFNFSTGQ
jgi:hypothetical protein